MIKKLLKNTSLVFSFLLLASCEKRLELLVQFENGIPQFYTPEYRPENAPCIFEFEVIDQYLDKYVLKRYAEEGCLTMQSILMSSVGGRILGYGDFLSLKRGHKYKAYVTSRDRKGETVAWELK